VGDRGRSSHENAIKRRSTPLPTALTQATSRQQPFL